MIRIYVVKNNKKVLTNVVLCAIIDNMKIEELIAIMVNVPSDYDTIASTVLELVEKHNKLVEILLERELDDRQTQR